MTLYEPQFRIPDEREVEIAEAMKESKSSYTFHEYQNQRIELKIIRLDVNLPTYRLKNFRTYADQLKYIQDTNVADDFFATGQENESAQRVQHDILVKFAEQGRSNSIVPIKVQLETEEQREPLLITSHGVVVNGNRRLAAMRELYIEDPSQYRQFSHIDCAVLPSNVTPQEILEIEVRLQMRADTKLPYSWISECSAIRELMNSGKTNSQVAELMSKKPKDVETSLKALIEVDLFLKDWLNRANHYEIVEDSEQAFKDLARAVAGLEEGELLDMKRRIAWVLFSNPEELAAERLYSFNFSFNEATSDVIDSLAQQLSIDLTASEPTKKLDDTDDDMELDFSEIGSDNRKNGSGRSLENLIAAIDDTNPNRREHIKTTLIAVCNSIYEQRKQHKTGNQALDYIKRANSSLMSADLSKADSSTYEAIGEQLEAIGKRVKALQNSLKQ